MRIVFLVSGGFAGLSRGCRIDTRSLAATERERLEALVAGSNLADHFERFSDAARDLKQYDLTIDRDGASVRMVCDEDCVPDPARPLVAYLAGRAVAVPPS